MLRTMTLIVVLTMTVSGLIISKTEYETRKPPTFQQALAAGSIEGLLLQYALEELGVEVDASLTEDTIGKLIEVVQDRDFDRRLVEASSEKINLQDIELAKRKLTETLSDFKQKAPGIISRAKKAAPGFFNSISASWDEFVDTVKDKWDDL